MKKIQVVLCLVMSAATLAVLGCANESTTAKTRWCSYEVATSRCKEIRRADHVCFVCSGAATCPDRRGQQVKVRYKGHDCVIKLGNRLSETCADCKEGKEVVEVK